MQELRDAHRRVETILESITDAFVSVDRDWRYVYVNDRGLQRLEAWRGRVVTREEILGRSMWEVFPDAAGTEVERRLRAAMDSAEPAEFELHFAPTGEWVEVRAYPSPSGLSVYYHNITGRHQAEEALREEREQRAEADRGLDDVRQAERSRIARDLHDGALQGLTHALVVAGRSGSAGDEEVLGLLHQIGRQLRAAIYDLRLEEHGDRPFSDALREVIQVSRETAPACDVTLEAGDLPSGSYGVRGTEVLRIVGEAVGNACRHAAARRVVVRIAGDESQLSVEVIDDGGGFDPGRQTPGLQGHGLRGMRERAEHLGARLEIRSDATGTTVRLQAALTPA
jgi:PAS domain S-box-containing protein